MIDGQAERERLEALYQAAILDTPPDERLDGVVAMAARRFNAPIALLSMVDADRVWFKVKIGIDLQQVPREDTFCSIAVKRESTLVVEDALQHPQFRNNPYVAGWPNLRFYAGAPIRTATNKVIGTLCIIDVKPRSFSEAELRDLAALGDFLSAELITRQDVMAMGGEPLAALRRARERHQNDAVER
jgi:GAF domain-containing protein